MTTRLILSLFLCFFSFCFFGQFLPAEIFSENGHEGFYSLNSAVGDLDGDELEDIAAFYNDNLYVMKGGNTSFTEEIIFPSPMGSISTTAPIELLDMDGDGDLDIARGNGWLENDDFTFDQPHFFTSLYLNSSTRVFGDVNADGFVDVVIPSVATTGIYYQHSLAILNDGTGEFLLENISVISEDYLNPITLSDADNDGDVDLFTSQSSVRKIFLNDGEGNFPSSVDMAGVYSSQPQAEDLNGDGIADLYFFNYNGFAIQFGQGNYQFGGNINVPFPYQMGAWADAYRNCRVDYEGDGDLDFLLQYSDGAVHFIRNEGNNNYSYVGAVSYTSNTIMGEVLWADLNDDNRMDCIRTIDIIYCSLQSETGEQIAHDIIANGINSAGSSISSILDFDEDGDEDIMASCMNGIGAYESDGDGGLSHVQFVASSSGLRTLGLDDFNGDGINDMLTVTYRQPNFILGYYDGIGNGEFGGGHTILSISGSQDFAFMDVDMDGKKDIVIHKLAEPMALNWYSFDNVNGLVGPHLLGTWDNDGSSSYGNVTKSIADGDFNGDGNKDIVVTSSGSLRIFHGNGTGSYTMVNPSRPIVSSEIIQQVVGEPADFNGDGKDDVLYVSINNFSGAAYCGLVKWNGNNYVHQVITIAGTLYTMSNGFVHTDFDLDGDEDLVYNNVHNVVVLANNGTGTFQTLSTTSLGMSNPNLFSVKTVDLDNNDLQDVVVGVSPNTYGASMQYYAALNNMDSPYQVHCHAFIDDNGDGIKDANEMGFNSRQLFFGDMWGYGYTNPDGDYIMYGIAGDITVELNENPDVWNATTPWTYTVSLSEGQPVADIYFGIQPNGYQPIVVGDLVLTEDMCGMDVPHWISITNMGNTIASGYYTLYLDSLMMVSYLPEGPQSLGNNQYRWFYEDLYYGEQRTIAITAMNPGAEYIGTSIHNSLITKITDENDDIIAVDTDVENFVVNCAYDPNMKEEENGWSDEGFVLPDAKLKYVIHFQNTGTAAASYVRIEDQLSEMLDWSTLQPMSSSHEYTARIEADGNAVFEFENIVLPDSGSNFIGSMGYITFTIDLVDGLPPGTIIENTAEIYFDANSAVVTETISNEVFDCVNLSVDIPPALCAGSSANLLSTRNEFESYTWQLDNQPAGEGEQLNIEFTGGPHNLILEVENPICQLSYEFEVEVETSPVFESISQAQAICGSPLALTASGNGSVVWSYNNEVIGNDGGVNASLPGEYVITLSNGCGITEESIILTEGILPEFTSFSENTTLCSDPLELNAFGNGSITWWLNDVQVGDNDLYLVTEAGNYVARLTNICGIAEQVLEVLPGEIPQFTSTAGDVLECAGESIVIYAYSEEEVTWYHNNEWAGEGENLFTEEEGLYVAMIDNGCLTNTADVNVIHLPSPYLEVMASGPYEFCEGDSVTLTLNTDATTVKWVTSEGGMMDVSSHTFYDTDFAQIVVSIDGCFVTANAVITEYENPEVVLEYDGEAGEVVATDGFISYQWEVDGVAGQETDNAIPAMGLHYDVIVMDENGCNGTASITISSADEVFVSSLNVYPNPAQDELMIEAGRELFGYSIQLFDMNGKLVKECGSLSAARMRLETAGLSAGVYTLKIANQGIRIILR